jgi:hypothetical protein
MQSMLGNDTKGNHQIEQGVEIEELEGQLKQGQNGKGVDGDKGSVRPEGGGQDICMIISEDVTREIEDAGINRGGD